MRPAAVGFHCPDDVNLDRRTIPRARTVVGAPFSAGQPWVTWGLIGLNVIVYLVTVVAARGQLNHPIGSSLFGSLSLQPYAVAQQHSFGRLITSAFLHVSVIHLVMNMVALGFVGPFLERLLGWWRYLSLYVVAALGGSVAVFLFADHFVAVAGASGAIYGLFGASLIVAQRVGLDLRALIITVAINFLLTFSIPNLSIEGHIGGFVAGGLAAVALMGLPHRPYRLSAALQAAVLTGLVVLLAVLVAVRTSTFPLPT